MRTAAQQKKIDRQRGQILPLFIIGLMALVMMLSLVFNTGHQIYSKTRLQNAVDASVTTQATAVARSLNLMSMNNVGFTQMFTLNVLQSALAPQVIEGIAVSGELMIDYVQEFATNISSCAPPYVIPPCFVAAWYAGLIVHLTVAVIIPLMEIYADLGFPTFQNIDKTFEMAKTLESMNKSLADNFLALSANISNELAESNGFSEQPIYVTGKAFETPQSNFGTNLPVDTLSIAEIVLPAFLPPLCMSGEYGTPSIGAGMMYKNFETHGYEEDEGPYTVGKDQFSKTIAEPTDALEDFPHGESLSYKFDDVIEAAWTAACWSMSTVSLSVPPRAGQFDVYRVNEPRLYSGLVGADREEWSILAVGQDKRSSGILGGFEQFPNPVRANYAYAQAEVYNLIGYDLYTQDWRAKLTPASLVTDQNYRNESAKTIKKYYKKMSEILEGLKQSETEAWNGH